MLWLLYNRFIKPCSVFINMLYHKITFWKINKEFEQPFVGDLWSWNVFIHNFVSCRKATKKEHYLEKINNTCESSCCCCINACRCCCNCCRWSNSCCCWGVKPSLTILSAGELMTDWEEVPVNVVGVRGPWYTTGVDVGPGTRIPVLGLSPDSGDLTKRGGIPGGLKQIQHWN